MIVESLSIALTCNSKKSGSGDGKPEDFYAEFDSDETINAVKRALESSGNSVFVVEADEDAHEKLRRIKPDIVFNIAEGAKGIARESHIPAMCEMLGIPYTASDVLTLAIALDKKRTKEVLQCYGIPTPRFQVFNSADDRKKGFLRFPLIVKPIGEGSSKGIRDCSVVETKEELKRVVEFVIKNYQQPALVEEFLSGKEFTVAVVGNGKSFALPIVEIMLNELPDGAHRIYSYEAKWIWDTPEKPLKMFECPANVPKDVYAKIGATALNAYRAIGCRDWCRVDVRIDRHGIPNVLELNPLPGILPDPKENSCFPKAAWSAGLSYDELINVPLYFALERNCLLERANNDYFNVLKEKLRGIRKVCSKHTVIVKEV